MDTLRITQDEHGVSFAVKVITRAPRDEIVGVENEMLKIRLHAPPVEGKANSALIEFMAAALGVARARIEIVRGASSRIKLLKVKGIDREIVETKLAG